MSGRWDPGMPAEAAPDRFAPRSGGRRSVDYVIDTGNVHTLTASLLAYAREKHYALILDASIFCGFDKLLAAQPLEGLRRQQLLNLRLFYSELLRLVENFESALILPEVKTEISNLIAAGLAQIDRKKVQYHGLSPARKDQVVELFNALLRIEEIVRKLRSKLEERSKALPRTNEAIFGGLLELVTGVAEGLQLKKPDSAARNDTDERIAARAFHDVIVHHRRVAVATRDEDVRRIIATVYKLLVSSTVREDGARIVTRALQLSNIVVLKWNADRDEYMRFFESQTLQEIGEFIFSKSLLEKAKLRVVASVRSKLLEVARRLEAEMGAAEVPERGRGPLAEPPPAVLEALATVWDRLLWYQEVARAVGVGDVHEEIRVLRAMREVAATLRHEALGAAIARTIEGLARKRLVAYLRALEEKSEALNRELAELTQSGRFRKEITSADRLKEVANEVAAVARERAFFERALATGQVHLTHEHFRRAEELAERFAANGFDLRDGEALVPAGEIADLSGRDYNAVLRIVSEQNLGHEGGLVRIDMSALVKHFL